MNDNKEDTTLDEENKSTAGNIMNDDIDKSLHSIVYDALKHFMNSNSKTIEQITQILSNKNISNLNQLAAMTKNDLDIFCKQPATYQSKIRLLNYFNNLNVSRKLYKSTERKVDGSLSITIKNAEFDSDECILTMNASGIMSNDVNNKEVKVKINPDNIEEFRNGDDKLIVHNPLVVLLGVSEFREISCPKLPGVKYDMIALKRFFINDMNFKVIEHNYKMWYNNDDINELWMQTIDELIDFRTGNLFNIHDGLIIIISTHGGDNIIYDSDEKAHNLYDIYKIFADKLSDIPRLFIVDACRGSEKIGSIIIDDVSKSVTVEEEKKDMNNIHKGRNRVTMFGQSPGIVSSASYNTLELENNGSSYFIRSIINRFKMYIYDNKYVSDNLTPQLSIMLSDIKNDLFSMSKNKQIPYKNGDVAMDSLQIFIKNRNNLKRNICEFDEFVNKQIAIRVYNKIVKNDDTKEDKKDEEKEENAIIDISDVSNNDLRKKLDVEFEEQLPILASIEHIKSTDKGDTTYHVKLLHNNQTIKTKLRDVVGININVFKNKQYGVEKQVNMHRYIKINVENNSGKYLLTLETKNSKKYLNECSFLQQPKFTTIPIDGGKQIFFIKGQRLNKKHELYQSYAETGVFGVLQYIIRDYKTNTFTGKSLLIGFATYDQENIFKNLKKPYLKYWIINKKDGKKSKLKKLANTLHIIDDDNSKKQQKQDILSCQIIIQSQ
eukprot:147349_1